MNDFFSCLLFRITFLFSVLIFIHYTFSAGHISTMWKPYKNISHIVSQVFFFYQGLIIYMFTYLMSYLLNIFKIIFIHFINTSSLKITYYCSLHSVQYRFSYPWFIIPFKFKIIMSYIACWASTALQPSSLDVTKYNSEYNQVLV